MRSNIFDRISFLSLFLVIVLLPLFCIPFTSIPIETAKGFLLVLGLVLSIIFWSIARFSDGTIVLPKSWLIASGGAIVLVFLLSALFSGNLNPTLFGTMFDLGSFWFIFAAFLLMGLSAVIFRTPKQAKIVLFGTILSAVVVILFQGIHLFAPVKLSLGILSGKTGNIFGSWNALGLFAGFAGLMYLFIIEFFPISRIERIILQVCILLSVLMAATVNFPLVWILLGISSLIIFVYKVSTFQRMESENIEKRFPLTSFAVVIIALIFVVAGPYIGNFIPNHLAISNTEVGPTLSATAVVTKDVIKASPLLGYGPDRFAQAWAMYKPQSVNTTKFWDVSFDSGSGLIPTLTATTGILGILSWLAFLVLFLVLGIKSVFSTIKSGVNWEMMAFFVLSLYLFVASFLYFSGAVIFLLALAFTGVFIGLSASVSGKEVVVSFLNDHRKSFFSILALICLVILSVAASFKYLERVVSVTYFNKAVFAKTEPVAEDAIQKALALYNNDLYLRTYSQVFLIKLNTIASKGANLSDADKTELQNDVSFAVRTAQLAVAYDPKNYLNYQFLGSVYQTLGALGIKDSYAQALTAYQTASTLNPLNPGIKIALSKAAYGDGKIQEAKDYANQAQALSPTDTSITQYINSLNNPTSTPAPTSTPSENTPKQ